MDYSCMAKSNIVAYALVDANEFDIELASAECHNLQRVDRDRCNMCIIRSLQEALYT